MIWKGVKENLRELKAESTLAQLVYTKINTNSHTMNNIYCNLSRVRRSQLGVCYY